MLLIVIYDELKALAIVEDDELLIAIYSELNVLHIGYSVLNRCAHCYTQ